MATYAKDTTVPVEKSKAEIERILQRYGADEFVSAWKKDQAVIMFRMCDRQVKYSLPLPDKNDPVFWYTAKRHTKRSEQDAHTAWEKACRQKWRALVLSIKADLEAVEAGIETFDQKFMSKIMLPNGMTASEYFGPPIELAYTQKKVPEVFIPWIKNV